MLITTLVGTEVEIAIPLIVSVLETVAIVGVTGSTARAGDEKAATDAAANKIRALILLILDPLVRHW